MEYKVMFEVRVEAAFSAAHFLTDYNGKCEHLHGHNYKVYAHAQGRELDGGGMLLDFGVLKKALRDVCNEMDHTNLNDMDVFRGNPSAERIAVHIYSRLVEKIPFLAGPAVRLSAVDVFETDTSRARYIPD